ncbi:fumarylacetoacetate hydrolase family protein [Shewanella eurypsychrophilus]|uniref:Fumarylacetoacetate hydrolase family protein n=1 Tax=Shewanella eurypsychrophilus TaxID=2593656 RepID=A0ABX6VA14_9GAMM|nr:MULTISPECIES: fumarylacetoacetate hydrolase family protein [Shewanella]QFU24070.1 FAA hydrolase family protein [Shewanella sp. YLB-09]QPG59279.1 fumarylacetoacetate hydrolase family protein [Shewanella eurypsychrophilus]
MSKYGLATYDNKGVNHAAIIIDEQRYDLLTAYRAIEGSDNIPVWVYSITEALAQWQSVKDEIDSFAIKVEALVALNELEPVDADCQILVPFKPSTIFGTASNYHEHAAEMNTILAAKPDSSPYVFMKANTSVTGSNTYVILPPETQKLDWEVELGVVIGKQTRRVKAEDALDCIAGYTVVNDISARDLNHRTDYPFKHDWFRGKSWDTFCPMGPVFVPKSCIDDPHKLALGLKLNGKQMQDGNTSELIWDAFEQIEYLSSILTLQPGDVIMTGTPAGVGKGIGLFLKEGDVLEAWAEGVGCITNTIKAEIL